MPSASKSPATVRRIRCSFKSNENIGWQNAARRHRIPSMSPDGCKQQRLTLRRKLAPLPLLLLVLMAVQPAQAQVRSLGKGWHLDAAGALTSAPGEVISGRNSIRGDSSGARPYASLLFTDPNFVRFSPGERYTVTLQYR